MMIYGLRKPTEIPLQQRALHELAKICWGKFVLKESISTEIDIPEKTRLLIAYRDKVLNRVPQILNAFLPKILIGKVINAVILLQRGYKEALLWEEKYQYALPTTILNPLTAGKYQAGNFIDATGFFNDLAWAKKFSKDENEEKLLYQLQIACFYGFDETILNAWRIMTRNYSQNLHEYPCVLSKQILNIESNAEELLVAHWFQDLKINFNGLICKDNSSRNNEFYLRGIRLATSRGYEYAAQFFWTRLSDTEKLSFLRELDFEIIAEEAEAHDAGLVHFYYSILSKEQIHEFLSSDFENHKRLGVIWSCLLDSPYYESVLEDARNFLIYSTATYQVVFSSLVLNVRDPRNYIHADIFEIMWNNLQQVRQKEVLEMDFNMIGVLIEIRRFDVLGIIIQSLSRDEKENILRDDWKSAGRSALNEFSKIGDYDSMLHYLICFFIDRNSYARKISFTTDPINLSNCYIKIMVRKWTETIISQSVKNEVNNVMNTLDRILHVTNGLL